jgi:hypothetical protein
MKAEYTTMRIIGAFLLSSCVMLIMVDRLYAQADNSVRKFDSYGAFACDASMWRLDSFEVELRNEPNAFGYIVVYPERNGLPGKYQSYLYFPEYYLAFTRNIPRERLVTLRGEYRDNLTTELWIGPAAASLPITPASTEHDSVTLRKFDEDFADIVTDQGKPFLRTYELCVLGALNFGGFAEYLRSEPKSKGRIIIHPEYGKRWSSARKLAYMIRTRMVVYGRIDSHRIVIVYGTRRKFSMVELWIVPS